MNKINLKYEDIEGQTYFYDYDDEYHKIKDIIFISSNTEESKLFLEKYDIYQKAVKEWNDLKVSKNKHIYDEDITIKYKKNNNSNMELSVLYKNNGRATNKYLTISNLKSFLALDEITVCGGIITFDRYQKKGIATRLYDFIDTMPELKWKHIPHSYAFNFGENTDASLNLWRNRKLPDIKDDFLPGLEMAEKLNKQLRIISCYGDSKMPIKRIVNVIECIKQNEPLLKEYHEKVQKRWETV